MIALLRLGLFVNVHSFVDPSMRHDRLNMHNDCFMKGQLLLSLVIITTAARGLCHLSGYHGWYDLRPLHTGGVFPLWLISQLFLVMDFMSRKWMIFGWAHCVEQTFHIQNVHNVMQRHSGSVVMNKMTDCIIPMNLDKGSSYQLHAFCSYHNNRTWTYTLRYYLPG